MLAAIFLLNGMLGLAEDSLMQREGSIPVFRTDRNSYYYQAHIANAAVLEPDEYCPDRWRLYIRGSAWFPSGDENYHDSIGLFVQDAKSFDPEDGWKEYRREPLLMHGPAGSYDEKHLLDCCPVVGADGVVYLYYSAKTNSRRTSLAGAVSHDGGYTFEKMDNNPLLEHVGPTDAIFYDGTYYVFYGDAKYEPTIRRVTDHLQIYVAVSDNPEDLTDAEKTLAVGVGEDDLFDSHSVSGGRVFRLKKRWYMVYQSSDRHFDYPDRFHVAWSDDLIEWTKVDNDEPFFERGSLGSWDDGGIWFGEVFEHDDTLWMFYEGWGGGTGVVNRDQPYYQGGRSQTGLASVSVKKFLRWCKNRR